MRILLPTVAALLVGSILLQAGGARAAEPGPPAPKQGDVPPAYVGRLLDGTDVRMDLSRGKAHVVTFWASWCGPCLQELPILSNLQRKVGTEQMQVVAVNIEERDVYRRVRGAVGDLGLTATHDPGALARKAFGVASIPHMVVVGRDGRIVSVRKGYSEAKLDAYVADFNAALAAPAAVSEGTSAPIPAPK